LEEDLILEHRTIGKGKRNDGNLILC